MPIHRSSPSMPACSALDDEGSGGARKTIFHAVSVLSRVMLATLSCVTFANRSYDVGTWEGPPGSSTTERGCQRIILDWKHSYAQSFISRPFSGKLTIVGFFSSTKLFFMNRL